MQNQELIADNTDLHATLMSIMEVIDWGFKQNQISKQVHNLIQEKFIQNINIQGSKLHS